MILELAKKEGVSVCERSVEAKELFEADEVFLAGTTIEVLPVIEIDEKPVGTGQPGSIAQRLSVCYQDFIRNYVRLDTHH